MTDYVFQLVISVFAVMLTIIGWSIARILSKLEETVSDLSVKLNETNIELAAFVSETKTTLTYHQSTLDKHGNRIETLGGHHV